MVSHGWVNKEGTTNWDKDVTSLLKLQRHNSRYLSLSMNSCGFCGVNCQSPQTLGQVTFLPSPRTFPKKQLFPVPWVSGGTMGNIVGLHVGYATGNACESWARPSRNFSHVACERMVIKLFINSNDKSLWLGSHMAQMLTVSLPDTRAVHFISRNTKILRSQKSNQH